MRRLEEEGVIVGYLRVLDQTAVGRPDNIFVEITPNQHSADCFESFEEAIRHCPDVLECHLMSGDADYLLRVTAAGTADYERIHTRCVARIRSNFALRTVLKGTALPLKG